MHSDIDKELNALQDELFDFVIIGSGFGGSVSSLRLAEKGYRVLLLERGKRFGDLDFPRSNWSLWKYLWLPALRFYGFLQLSILKDVVALHGSGVGGGSLVYASVLVEPDENFYNNLVWDGLANWQTVLAPHFKTAKRMLGVTQSPRFYPSDDALRAVAERMGKEQTFSATDVGIFFDDPGTSVEDPYFNGKGPSRSGCIYCGGCMVGCRHNSKNTLVKNYLYLAERLGVRIVPETEVVDCGLIDEVEEAPIYELLTSRSTGFATNRQYRIRARNIVFSAGVLGTLRLLLHCRDGSKRLPKLSQRLGENVRTNSEAFLGAISNDPESNHTHGVPIGSVFMADSKTHVETFRFPEGSSFLYRLLTSPLLNSGSDSKPRLIEFIRYTLRHPKRFLDSKFNPSWGRKIAPLLVMQTEDNLMKISLSNNRFPLFGTGLDSKRDAEKPVVAEIPIAHEVTHMFAEEINGEPLGNIFENLFDVPLTAHILGGCSFGASAEDGVVNQLGEVFNYRGLYIADGSLMPANPGLNPSLTITALAEHVMSHVPDKKAISGW